MENQRYMRDGVDIKRVLLLFRKKWWMLAAAVAAGALLGGSLYLLWHLVLAPEREYQSVSKLYLNFNCEPEDYNQLAYNGYTWNDLMAANPILDYTMEALPDDISRDMVIAATKAEILSDIRLLTITITAPEPQTAAQIMEATQQSLVHLGETDELFHSIEVYGTTEPAQIVWDNRTVRAVLTGTAAALMLALLGMAFYYVLDDSVYVEGDVQKRYGVAVLGVFTEQFITQRPEAEQAYGREFLEHYRYLSREMKTVFILSADDKQDVQMAEEGIRRLDDERQTADRSGEQLPKLLAGGTLEETDAYCRMREADGVLLTVRCGSRNGRRVEHILNNLEQQDCRLLGVVLMQADEKFLKLYY